MAKGNGKTGRRNGRNGSNTPQEWEPEPRDLEIYSHVIEGVKTHQQIAEEFGYANRSSISRLAKKVDAWLTPQWMDDIRAIKCRHTENLLHIFQQAMRAWEDSQLDEVTVKVESVVVGEDQLTGEKTTTTRKINRVGNPAFLSQARAALADIRKIWGADAPVEQHHSEEPRVAGMSRTEACLNMAGHYRRLADRAGG